MIVTVLEARVAPEQEGALRAAYDEAGRDAFPPGLIRSRLLRDRADPDRWRIETVWRSFEDLAAMRQQPGPPRGVMIFQAAGAEPVLTVFDLAAEIGP